MDGLLVIAMNKHRELCTLQSSGGVMLLSEQVGAAPPRPGTAVSPRRRFPL